MIAERIGCSVNRAKAETSSFQFVQWKERITRAWNERSRQDYFLAEIAYQIHILPGRLFGKTEDAPEITAEDFMHRFNFKSAETKDAEPNKADEAEMGMAFRNAVLRSVGLTTDGKLQESPAEAARNKRMNRLRDAPEGKELHRGRLIHNKAVKPIVVRRKDADGR